MRNRIGVAVLCAYLPGMVYALEPSGPDYFRQDAQGSFIGAAFPQHFLLRWSDVVRTVVPGGGTFTDAVLRESPERVGGLSMTLTDSTSNQVILQGDRGAIGGFMGLDRAGLAQSFLASTALRPYVFSIADDWYIPSGTEWVSRPARKISVAVAPEREKFAMFLAGLGIIGLIARRRGNA